MPSFETVEIPVKLCKRGRKADAGKLLRETRDAIEKTEFTPDNSKCEYESRGLQSRPISVLSDAWSLGAHQLAEYGFVPLFPVVSFEPAQVTFNPRKPYWCEPKPCMFGTAIENTKPVRRKGFKAAKYTWM